MHAQNIAMCGTTVRIVREAVDPYRRRGGIVGGMQSVIDVWKTGRGGEELTTLIILVLIFARSDSSSYTVYTAVVDYRTPAVRSPRVCNRNRGFEPVTAGTGSVRVRYRG